MKYIRTKDGIYEVEMEIAVDCDAPYYRVFGKDYDVPFEEVINQADTIEELIDEYVVGCSEDYEYPEYYPKVCVGWLLDDYSQEDGFVIYGAIWTDKGLIYVAKMNDKGELELI